VACDRRKAIKLLAAGQPHEALVVLKDATMPYVGLLTHAGLNFLELHILEPLMAALKVFAEALMQVNLGESVNYGKRIRADVEETEATPAGYWEGVLEETRWELEERRRAAAAAAAGAAVEAAATAKRSKTAKRKQQKRKAQQQRKGAELAEVTQGQGENGQQAQEVQRKEQEQEEQEQEEEVKDEAVEEGEEGDNQQAVTAALAAMAVGETNGQEEEEECSVCLNAIDGGNDDNPAGPALVCEHRYHAFCLHSWVEKCASKCIEATCPYCRAPLGEMGEMVESETEGGEGGV